MNDTRKCAHAACSCIIEHDKKYCSAPCADAKDMTELACQCDHPACQGERLKP